MSEKKLLLCYNRGCGQSFDPDNNNDDSCRHHSGAPVFHDAYKGWSCCNKKCTDFTEFLNIKGCTVTKHTNVKPPEPEKPKVDKSLENDIIEYKAPTAPEPKRLERPPFNTPLAKMNVTASKALMDQLAALKSSGDGRKATNVESSTEIAIGTACKNNACKVVYEGPDSLQTTCTHHPGYPVFHEGLKFWSCCTKRTTEFDNFLAQVGCSNGEHLWFKPKVAEEVQCRLDWYQTASHVHVSIFGKKCDPDASLIELSPIRLKFALYFPDQNGTYSKDMELAGIADVAKSTASMTPAKVEISLKKSEGGSWPKLEIARSEKVSAGPTKSPVSVTNLSEQVDSVDLSDL